MLMKALQLATPGKKPTSWMIHNVAFIQIQFSARLQRGGRLLQLVRMQMELWESLAWMSTLGGAYSCLGENDRKFVSTGTLCNSQQIIIGVLHFNYRSRL